MTRALFLAVCAILLCAAAPQPRLTPQPPILGRPATLILPFTESGWELAGLPDLAPFELLAPPQAIDRELRLHLLPMRSGPARIPPLPLQYNGKPAGNTLALTVTVGDDLPATASPAPVKTTLATRGEQLLYRGGLLAALGLTLLFGIWRYVYSRPPRPLPLAALPPQQLLSALARRLDDRIGDEVVLAPLRARIATLRFGPHPPDAAELAALLAEVLALDTGER